MTFVGRHCHGAQQVQQVTRQVLGTMVTPGCSPSRPYRSSRRSGASLTPVRVDPSSRTRTTVRRSPTQPCPVAPPTRSSKVTAIPCRRAHRPVDPWSTPTITHITPGRREACLLTTGPTLPLFIIKSKCYITTNTRLQLGKNNSNQNVF